MSSRYVLDVDTSGAGSGNSMAFLQPYDDHKVCFNVTVVGDSAVEDNLECIEIHITVSSNPFKGVTIIIQDDDRELHANGIITF